MKIDKGTVAWNGLMNCVAAAIKEWVPKPFKTEARISRFPDALSERVRTRCQD